MAHLLIKAAPWTEWLQASETTEGCMRSDTVMPVGVMAIADDVMKLLFKLDRQDQSTLHAASASAVTPKVARHARLWLKHKKLAYMTKANKADVCSLLCEHTRVHSNSKSLHV